MTKKLFALLLCIVSVLFSAPAVSVIAEDDNTVGKAEALADGIVAFQLSKNNCQDIQEWIGGALSEEAGIGAEWYVLSLSQSGDYDFSSYERSLLAYLENNKISSASSRQKYALCLSAVGSTDRYIYAVLKDSIGKQGIMSLIYGLHLLNNGYSCESYTEDSIIDELISLQCSDGGWSLSGVSGDVDVSAMAVQSMAVYYADNEKAHTAIDKALDFLSARQLEDGTYISYGRSNAESTAQVIVTLSSLGIDCLTDNRFIKNHITLFDALSKFILDDGSFSHAEGGESSSSATAQVLYATVAYMRMTEGKTPLYILDKADPENLQSAPTESDTEDESAPPSPESSSDYKIWATVIAVSIGVIVCALLFLLKKLNKKNLLVLLVALALAVTFILATDFRSAEDYYNGEDIIKDNPIGSVTIAIYCDAVAGKTDSEYISPDGVILSPCEFVIEEGDTVLTVLTEAARKHGIQVENNGSSEMAYISGINYLYEFDFGDLSGWTYYVNGAKPSVSCGEYKLSDGDLIEWRYTLTIGK